MDNPEDGRITMNDLFGDDHRSSQRDNKGDEKSRKGRTGDEGKDKKPGEWKKEEGESPDSGFVDESQDSDRERQAPHM